MRTVYANQYQVIPWNSQSIDDCFADLQSRMRRWIEDKYKNIWNCAVTLPSSGNHVEPIVGHRLQVELKSANGAEFITVDWVHPHDRDPSTQWTTTCLLARIDNAIEIALLLRVSATEMVLRPTKYQVGRPRFVSEILTSYQLKANGWPVPTKVDNLTPVEVPGYVNDVLLTKERTLPVVMVSPAVWNGTYLVNDGDLINKLLGFSHVAKLSDKWAAYRLTDEIGKPFACYNGAVRIYWPGMTLSDNPFDHFLYLPNTIRSKEGEGSPLADDLFRVLCGVSALRFVEGKILSATRKTIASFEREEIDNLRKQVESGTLEKSKLQDDLLNALIQIESLTSEKENLREDIASRTRACIECRTHMIRVDTHLGQQTAAEEECELKSVHDALMKAKDKFQDVLHFLESAEESAKKSVYKNPNRVFEAFEALHDVASSWSNTEGKLGKSWKDALRERGFDIHQVSQTSGTKWKNDYSFTYKGKSRLFSDHITIGAKQADKCCSIHWFRDDVDKVLVIGYCGEHLPNTKT